MMNIVFLSCESLDGHVVDDHILVQELERKGYSISTLPWNIDTDWSKFDCAIIRTTWDYVNRPQEFLQKLEKISQETRLLNSLSTIKWNIHKSYLSEFEAKGITIVPTLFFKNTDPFMIPTSWECDKIVIKPAISAGSFNTMVFTKEELKSEDFRSKLMAGDWMCQPYLPQISEGEISLIYFNKKFSHGLIKTPKSNEFRVQEEFGGEVRAINPDPELLKAGEKIINAVSDELLYARVDFIPHKNQYALMELELIEPSLYFRTHPSSALNFIMAFENV
jgi:glutathione synthase/RimK-type ligase-like ATP-grasp enzyme